LLLQLHFLRKNGGITFVSPVAIFKHTVRTAKKTQHCTVTNTTCLTLFKQIIAACYDTHTKQILCEQNADFFSIKVDGIYSYHLPLKRQSIFRE
jgi:hypothetical protein